MPVNVDRVLGASYNTRSVLEALLANTPYFHMCRPLRIEISDSTELLKRAHKCLMWTPQLEHGLGSIAWTETDAIVSEVSTTDTIYEPVEINEGNEFDAALMNVERRHARIQIALIKIGRQLGFRTWVARNDRSITYGDRRIADLDGVIPTLQEERLISSFDNAVEAAAFIDCIWFKNGRLMPAVIEIEHSTGVTSGLTRMQRLQLILPRFDTRWVIAAPDEDRDRVLHECNREQFRALDARYMPYSAVDELHALCQRRNIQDVGEKFLDAFMERTLHLS
jgi:type II restriction enzyme